MSVSIHILLNSKLSPSFKCSANIYPCFTAGHEAFMNYNKAFWSVCLLTAMAVCFPDDLGFSGLMRLRLSKFYACATIFVWFSFVFRFFLPCCFLYPLVFLWLSVTLCSRHVKTSDYPIIYARLPDYPCSAHLFISFAECKLLHSSNSSSSFYLIPALVLSHIVHSEYSLVFLFWLRCVLWRKNENKNLLTCWFVCSPACQLTCMLAALSAGHLYVRPS